MSDAERRGGRQRERLDWGDDDAESAQPTEPAQGTELDQPTEPASETESSDSDRTDDDPDADRKAELCSVEDPTCEACQ